MAPFSKLAVGGILRRSELQAVPLFHLWFSASCLPPAKFGPISAAEEWGKVADFTRMTCFELHLWLLRPAITGMFNALHVYKARIEFQ